MRKRYKVDLIRKRDRWNKILQLCIFNQLSVPELAERAYASKSVIRTDLIAMAKLGYIQASRNMRSSTEFTLYQSLINRMPDDNDLDKMLNDIEEIPTEPPKNVLPNGARLVKFDNAYFENKLAQTQKLRTASKQNVWIGNTLSTMQF